MRSQTQPRLAVGPEKQTSQPESKSSMRRRGLIPAALFLILVVISLFAYQWNRQGFPIPHRLNVLSEQNLQEKYGLQVSLVGVSMMGSIIDLRFKVLDAEKAHLLLDDPARTPVLMVEDNKKLILKSTRGHRHGTILKDGTMYIMFFPNTENAVKTGTPVRIVFGDMQLEPVIAQ